MAHVALLTFAGVLLRHGAAPTTTTHLASAVEEAMPLRPAEKTTLLKAGAGAIPTTSTAPERNLVIRAPETSAKHDDEETTATTDAASAHAGEMNCQATLQQLCRAARAASTGNCLVCCGQHQLQLQRAGCAAADFDPFCREPAPAPWPYSCDAGVNATQIATREPRGLMSSQVVLITGADGHMGMEIVRAVALAGAKPLLSCRTAAKCTTVLEMMKQELPPAIFARFATTPPIGTGLSCDLVGRSG